MKIYNKINLLILPIVSFLVYGCGSDSDTVQEITQNQQPLSEPVLLSSANPYKEINTFDDAALALKALHLYSKTKDNKEIFNAVQDEIISDIMTPGVDVREEIACDNGGVLLKEIDTETRRHDYRRVRNEYRWCELNATLKDGYMETYWNYKSDDNDTMVIDISYNNQTLGLLMDSPIFIYNILDDNNSFDFNITSGYVQNKDYIDIYSNFRVVYNDLNKSLEINGVMKKEDKNCMDGTYLIKTLAPIVHYGYDDTELKGKISINNVIYEFDEYENVEITLQNGTTMKENARNYIQSAECPYVPPSRR